jgi:hypothetical protein
MERISVNLKPTGPNLAGPARTNVSAWPNSGPGAACHSARPTGLAHGVRHPCAARACSQRVLHAHGHRGGVAGGEEAVVGRRIDLHLETP